MSPEDKYINFSTKDQEQFITSDNKILKVKAELELVEDEKGETEIGSTSRLILE